MAPRKLRVATSRYEACLKGLSDQQFVMRLYITGATPASARAIQNLKTICETHLVGRFQLEVIDIFQQPWLAKGEQIFATPTLVRELPRPLRKFVGDLSDLESRLFEIRPPPRETPGN